ncbi:DUF2247 family protein [Fusobacterium sp. PH5-44]|uniref:DUF2247 family protein n=1 Tax=unclassified Fusobacterium TaxID=2648384 RepID=UPI003D1B5FF7
MSRNTLNLKIPYDYMHDLIELSWSDIEFFIEEGYLADEGAILHSYKVLENDENAVYNDDIISLSLLIKKQAIYPFFDRLLKKDTSKNKSLVMEKALFIILSWLYENKDKYDDPLGMVEVIYEDFDFSNKVEGFVRYMPAKNLRKAGEKQMYIDWKKYLEEERKYLEEQLKEN